PTHLDRQAIEVHVISTRSAAALARLRLAVPVVVEQRERDRHGLLRLGGDGLVGTDALEGSQHLLLQVCDVFLESLDVLAPRAAAPPGPPAGRQGLPAGVLLRQRAPSPCRPRAPWPASPSDPRGRDAAPPSGRNALRAASPRQPSAPR